MGIKEFTHDELIQALIHYKLKADCLEVAINDIKLWCEASCCEKCGKKDMIDTDCYDYVTNVLDKLEKITAIRAER
jgi:hypothetical protein